MRVDTQQGLPGVAAGRGVAVEVDEDEPPVVHCGLGVHVAPSLLGQRLTTPLRLMASLRAR